MLFAVAEQPPIDRGNTKELNGVAIRMLDRAETGDGEELAGGTGSAVNAER